MSQFLFAMDSNFEPIVGQQVTLTETGDAGANARIDLLRARADAGACDLIAKTRIGGMELGFVHDAGGFTPSLSVLPSLSDAQVRALAIAFPVTYTCAPPGSGVRIGIDRDGDGHRDGDEVLAGSDPADPQDTP